MPGRNVWRINVTFGYKLGIVPLYYPIYAMLASQLTVSKIVTMCTFVSVLKSIGLVIDGRPIRSL